MKKKLLSSIIIVAFGTFAFANSTNSTKNFTKIDDVKFIKGICTMRLTYTNPNTGQITSWIESYETATAADCGKLLTKRIQQLSVN